MSENQNGLLGASDRLSENQTELLGALDRLSENQTELLGASGDCRRIKSGSWEGGLVDLPSRRNISSRSRADRIVARVGWRDGERNGARARWRIILLAQGAALGLACRTPEGSSCNERGAIRCGAARIGWACALARWGTQWRPCALSPCAPGDRTRRQRGHHVSDRTPRGCDILSPGQHPGRRAARRSHGTGRQLQLRAAPSSPNARC